MDSVYLLGLFIVLVEKRLDPVSIVRMDSFQVLNLHKETNFETSRPSNYVFLISVLQQVSAKLDVFFQLIKHF